jgi:hypothetical protein
VVRFPARVTKLSFSNTSRPILVPTQPSIQWVQWVMRPEREADHSRLITRSRLSDTMHILRICFHGLHRESFTLTDELIND